MILDTGFIIDLMYDDNKAKVKLAELLKLPEPLSISAITVAELFHGVGRASVPEEEESKIHRVLRGLIVHPVDFELGRRAGKLDGELTKKEKQIGIPDAIIAATALSLNEPVITRNVKDFSKIFGLEIIDY